MKCLRCDVEMKRMALRTRKNYMTDDYFFAKIRMDEIDDDTVYITDPYDASAFTQGHSTVDAMVCPQCGHIELIAARLDTLFPINTTEKICPHCAKIIYVVDSPTVLCPECGKGLYEKVPGRKYMKLRDY